MSNATLSAIGVGAVGAVGALAAVAINQMSKMTGGKKASAKKPEQKILVPKVAASKSKVSTPVTPTDHSHSSTAKASANESDAGGNPAEAPGHRKMNMAESQFIPQNQTLAQHNVDARQKFTRSERTRVNGASHRRTLNSRGK